MVREQRIRRGDAQGSPRTFRLGGLEERISAQTHSHHVAVSSRDGAAEEGARV